MSQVVPSQATIELGKRFIDKIPMFLMYIGYAPMYLANDAWSCTVLLELTLIEGLAVQRVAAQEHALEL
ncbi:hypothetical protein D3C75_970370 [compost metagenome]